MKESLIIYVKKGVATEIILTVGILLAAGLTLVQVKSIFVSQERLSEKEIVVEFAKDLENIVNKALSATGDTAFVYVPPISKYRLEIRDNVVRIKDKISGDEASFVVPISGIVETSFEDSENITIIKKGGKLYLLGRCLKEGEKCTSSLACCEENPYCWGEEHEFICRKKCAPNGEYAADAEACCSGYLNETSGKCEELPVCPQERICEGAPEAEKDSLGRDCCPPDRPLCVNGHCCPTDKPKWCSHPKTGEARCMGEEEYEVECKKPEFVLLVIPMNVKPPDIETLAETCKDTWVSLSPLRECPESVEVEVIKEPCRISNECDADRVLQELRMCAREHGYGNIYTRIVGIKHGSYVCKPGIGGYTQRYADVVVTIDAGIGLVCSHEMGHTFGLCDEGYGNSLCPHCDSGICALGGTLCEGSGPCCPNKPEKNSIMCSRDICGRGCTFGRRFAPSSYSHLEKELNKYCG